MAVEMVGWVTFRRSVRGTVVASTVSGEFVFQFLPHGVVLCTGDAGVSLDRRDIAEREQSDPADQKDDEHPVQRGCQRPEIPDERITHGNHQANDDDHRGRLHPTPVPVRQVLLLKPIDRLVGLLPDPALSM